jgi:hypothetical protein
MCTPPPKWEIPAGWQLEPTVFRTTSLDKREYTLAPYSNGFSQFQEWNAEQGSQESDNEGDMFSLIGSSPESSNKNDQVENEELGTLDSLHQVGKAKAISDIEGDQCSELEDNAHLRVLSYLFTSHRPILVRNSSGWHGK